MPSDALLNYPISQLLVCPIYPSHIHTGDLKPDNILLKRESSSPTGIRTKIAEWVPPHHGIIVVRIPVYSCLANCL